MENNFIHRILDIFKKYLFLVLLGTYILGGTTVFLVLEKKIDSADALELENGEAGDDDGEVKKDIYVDVSGAVNKPGVYKIDNSGRVWDLISLAGGVANDASSTWVSKNLNLSMVLQDSAKIYIPFEWEFYLPENYSISKTVNGKYASGGGSDNNSSSNQEAAGNSENSNDQGVSDGGEGDTSDQGGVGEDGKINVNTASSSELDTLPGIGPANAEKIISSRPYADFSDFESRSGLYKSTVANIKDSVTF